MLTVALMISSLIPHPKPTNWDRMQFDAGYERDYFVIYQYVKEEPHAKLVIRNWQKPNPVVSEMSLETDDQGRLREVVRVGRKQAPHEIGDLNCDDIVDLKDFGLSAKYFPGGLYKPEPELSDIEILALMMKLFVSSDHPVPKVKKLRH